MLQAESPIALIAHVAIWHFYALEPAPNSVSDAVPLIDFTAGADALLSTSANASLHDWQATIGAMKRMSSQAGRTVAHNHTRATTMCSGWGRD